nr:Wzz/FepE/Etk N-terminal domain-containing protein [Pseudomonas putida]
MAVEEEFDLFRIFRELWRRRVIIAAIAFVFMSLGASYAFFATPEYEVRTVLRPAALNDLDALNRSNVYSLPPGEALIRMGAALDSYEIRLSYFRSKPELVAAYNQSGETSEQAFTKFNDAFQIVQPDPKKADLLSAFIGLKMRYEGDIDGASYLNDFVAYAIKEQRAQLAEDLKGIVANRLQEVDAKLKSAMVDYDAGKQSRIAILIEKDAIKRALLQDELKALRVQLKLNREARLASLDESIAIAKSLGIKKPASPSSMADEVVEGGNVVRTEINTQQVPLYFMGADVLEAERNVLRKRTSDDFAEPRIAKIRKELLMLASNREAEALQTRKNEILFLDGIQSLRAERERLKSINTDLEQLRLVNVDQYATPPAKPLKPRKGLIIGFSLFIGIIVGAFFALLRGMLKARLRRVRDITLAGSVGREGSNVITVS